MAEAVAAEISMSPQMAGTVDVVIDTVGGEIVVQAFDWLRPGGILVSAVSEPDKRTAALRGALTSFILVNVNTADLQHIGQVFQARKLRPHIGEVLRLSQVRAAHEMLEGGRHRPGKIVLVP